LTLATGHLETPCISLEAHGTGTALGDPIEVGAAVRALCSASHVSAVHCAAVKSNQGHLEAAAATAGLSSLSLLALAWTLHAMPCSF